jgi:hypothetical protein
VEVNDMSFFKRFLSKKSAPSVADSSEHASEAPTKPLAPPTSSAARPAATAAGGARTVKVDGTPFRLVNSVGELCQAIEEEGRGALRFRSKTYGDVLADFTRRVSEKYGKGSGYYRDTVPSPLLCAGCLWEFPGSYKMSLQMPQMFGGRNRVFGATPGFSNFGNSGACPKCGSEESLLVYEHFKEEEVSAADVEAIAEYWRDLARAWWSGSSRTSGICDFCNAGVEKGEGYLEANSLICQRCVDKGLKTEGLERLRSDPHYYGAALLRKARQRRAAGG